MAYIFLLVKLGIQLYVLGWVEVFRGSLKCFNGPLITYIIENNKLV